MKPCETIQYDEWWFMQNVDLILPTPEDENFCAFLNADYGMIEGYLEIATAVKVNGINQSFIAIAKEKYPGAIAHCEYYVSPMVHSHYCQEHGSANADKLVSVGLAYFLSEWFDVYSLIDAHLLSYWALSPGALKLSAKRKRQVEEGKFNAKLKEYSERYHLSDNQLEYFGAKLQKDGISQYLGLLNPHPYLEYCHVMDVLSYYLHKDVKLVGKLAMLYFPHHVIDDIIKA